MAAEGRVVALVLAAGPGSRLRGGAPKGFRLLGGTPLFLHSLVALDGAAEIGESVLVVPSGWGARARAAAEGRTAKPLLVCEGGERRQDSVLRGLRAIAGRLGPSGAGAAARLVAVHDAARPFLSAELISRAVACARLGGGALPAIPAADTVRERDPGTGVERVLDRDRLRLAQTPQVARLDWLLAAYERAERDGEVVTDEGAALARDGRSVGMVEGSARNFKITTPEDLDTAEAVLARGRSEPSVRIGYGEDRHSRAADRPFILAGIELEARSGPTGHSDGDPLCHALVDALLGAAGLGSIGDLFPDTDPRWKGAPGLDLLARAAQGIASAGWRAVNVDAVVLVDEPRLAPHVPEIRRRIAAVLGIGESAVSVKGKRAEGLGFEGRGEGLSCRAVALVSRGAGGGAA